MEEVLLRVKSVAFESVGESSVKRRLEESSGIELKYLRILSDNFSDVEGVFLLVPLMLVSFN